MPVAGMLLASDLSPAVSVPVTVGLKTGLAWPSCRGRAVKSDHDGQFILPWDFNPESMWHADGNFTGVIILDSPVSSSWPVGTLNVTGPEHQQVAFCPDGPLAGKEVQTRFLDALTDARVRCPSGKLVESTLVLQRAKGGWAFCQSLCPLQTCAALHGKINMSDVLQDVCLMGNIRKNFEHANTHGAASPEAALLWLIERFCPARLGTLKQITEEDASVNHDDGNELVADVQRSLVTLAKTYDPLRGAGDGKYIVLDTSGSMGGVLAALRSKLGVEYPRTTTVSVHDSNFRARGSMGRELLKVLQGMAEHGSVVVIVSDFQDGADVDFCDSLSNAARERNVVLALESVQLNPQPCLSQVAESSGGSVKIGRIMHE